MKYYVCPVGTQLADIICAAYDISHYIPGQLPESTLKQLLSQEIEREL